MSEAALRLFKVVRQDRRVTPTGKLVFYVLAWTHDQETGDCKPSLRALERETGECRKAVIEGIKSLEVAGYIKKRLRFKRTDGGRENISNSYTILRIPKGGSAVSEPPSSGVLKAAGVVQKVHRGVVQKMHPSTVRAAPTPAGALVGPLDDLPILVEDPSDDGEERGGELSRPEPQHFIARSTATASPDAGIEEVRPGPAVISLYDWQREADDVTNPDAWRSEIEAETRAVRHHTSTR